MVAAGGEGPGLEFDKDDRIAMSFVAAASNLRSRVFQVMYTYCRRIVKAFFLPARDAQ